MWLQRGCNTRRRVIHFWVKYRFRWIAVTSLLLGMMYPGPLPAAEFLTFKIHHVPPANIEPGEKLTLVADIIPYDQVAVPIINWRTIGEDGYRRNRMKLVDATRDRFSVTFPAGWLARPGFEYFISVVDVDKEHHVLFKDREFPQKIYFVGEEPAAADIGMGEELLEEFALFAAEDIVFAAAKHEQKLIEAPSAVSVISGEMIRASGLNSIPEILRMVPGLEVYEISPGYPVVGCRGFTDEANNLMVVLLDGREMNSPIFGSTFYSSLPVSPEEIERIEVIRGPGSALYGANAFSGVVNIVTQSERGEDLTFAGSLGSQSHVNELYADGFARAGGKIADRHHYYIGAGYRKQSFWSRRPGNAVGLGYAKASYLHKFLKDDKVQVLAEGGIDFGKWDYFFPLSPVGFEGDEYFGRLNVRAFDATVQVYFSQMAVDLDFVDPAIKEDMLGGSTIPLITNLIDVSLQYDYDFGRWSRLIVGGNFRINQFRSSRFDYPLPTDKMEQEMNYGGFVQDEIRPLDVLILTVGLRYDASDTIEERIPSPRATLIYLPRLDHAVRLAVGQAFRKPHYLEYGMRIEELEEEDVLVSQTIVREFTEKVQSVELGYSGKVQPQVKAGADLYFNRYSDLIDFSYEDNQYFNWEQKSKVDSYGGELWADAKVGKLLTLQGNYSFNQIVSNWENLELGVQKGVRLTHSPQHKFNLVALFRYEWLLSRLAIHYYAKRTVSDFRDPVRNVLPQSGTVIYPIEVDPFVVLNFRVACSLWEDTLEAGFTAQNLLALFGDQTRQFPGSFWAASLETSDFGGERIGGLLYGTITLRF